jgi:hypothetical protein
MVFVTVPNEECSVAKDDGDGCVAQRLSYLPRRERGGVEKKKKDRRKMGRREEELQEKKKGKGGNGNR